MGDGAGVLVEPACSSDCWACDGTPCLLMGGRPVCEDQPVPVCTLTARLPAPCFASCTELWHHRSTHACRPARSHLLFMAEAWMAVQAQQELATAIQEADMEQSSHDRQACPAQHHAQ